MDLVSYLIYSINKLMLFSRINILSYSLIKNTLINNSYFNSSKNKSLTLFLKLCKDLHSLMFSFSLFHKKID